MRRYDRLKALEGVSEDEDTDSQEKYPDEAVAQTLSVNDLIHRLDRFACSILRSYDKLYSKPLQHL